MIEVTDEMLKVARSMQSFELMIKRIIELHEQSKPKPEPVGYTSEKELRLLSMGYISYVWSDNEEDDCNIPIYTNQQPKREPLSDDEIEKLVPWQGNPKDPFFNRIKFARLVEQAHGIGGDNV